jgi:hypothetical protein
LDCLSKAILKKLTELNISQEEFAYRLAMTRKTLYLRLKNPEQFKLWELKRIKEILGIPVERYLNEETKEKYKLVKVKTTNKS